jgi:hypothetical protein
LCCISFARVPIWDAAFLFTLPAFVVDSFNIEMLHVFPGIEGRKLSGTARQNHRNEISKKFLRRNHHPYPASSVCSNPDRSCTLQLNEVTE